MNQPEFPPSKAGSLTPARLAECARESMAAEWAAGERVCCPFLDIQLLPESDGAALRLRLTGKEGVKQFLRAEGVV